MNKKYPVLLLFTVLTLAPARAQHGASAVDDGARSGPRLTATAADLQGFFASFEYLTYNAATAVDARGGVHLAFYTSDERHEDDPLGQPAFYTYCPGAVADCSDPGRWSALVQFDSRVSEVQIVATPDGRPRLLVRRNGNRANEYDFYACEQECGDAQNWSGLFVTEAAGVELFNTDLPQHSFALDAQGRPRFVYSNGWGVGRPTAIYYAYCDAADCTLPETWQETTVYGPLEGLTVTSDYATLVFDGDRPRVLTRYNQSGLPVRVDYYQCDADCGDPAGWGQATLPHPEGKLWANWDLALDAAGRPRVALYEAAPIDIVVGGKLFYGWCDADCTGGAPFQIVQVASGEGKNVDLVIEPGSGRTYMIYDAGQRGVLGAAWCDGTCTNGGAWDRQILETSERLEEAFAPASPFTCNQEERLWLDAVPEAAFDAQGRLVVAYDVKNVSTCYYTNPNNPNGPLQSRVERLWWAARVDFFEAPDQPSTPVEEGPETPDQARLDPNFPNPFNPSTTVPFTLREAGPVRLAVYDLLGRQVDVLIDGVRPAGVQHVVWDATGIPSGLYLYRLEANSESLSRTLTLLK